MNRVLWFVGRRRPLIFFGVPGMLLLAAGLIVGVFVSSSVLRNHVTPLGTALISTGLCLAGAATVYAGLILSTLGKLETALEDAEADDDSTAITPTWPLLALGIPGMLGLLAGLAWGGWAVSVSLTRDILLYGSFIGSSSLVVAGLITWLTGMVLHTLHDILANTRGTEIVSSL